MTRPIYLLALVFALAITSLIVQPCRGQNYVDLARITYSNTPENAFDTSDGSTRLREMLADVTLPVKLNDSLAIVTGFFYENVRAKMFPDSTAYTTAHTAMLKCGLSVVHNARLSASYLLIPKLSSDLRRVDGRDIQYGATAIFKLKSRTRENFLWQFGGMYNTELSGPFFVPLLGLYYKSPNARFETNVLLPASVDMNYQLSPSVYLGGSFVSNIRSYHIHQKGENAETVYWNKSTNEVFGYLQWSPVQGLLLQARGGYSVARRFSVYDMGDKVDLAIMAFKFGNDRKLLNPWFSDGGIFQLRLIYRFYMK